MSDGAHAAGLSNADFRKIMATPRQVDVEDTPMRTPSRPTKDGFARPNAPSALKFNPNKASSKKSENLLPDGYRDRAQERREREHAGVADAPIENEQITAEEIEALPQHLSKYLGGDADRSHLVKGLDYLLLQQSREAISKEEEQKLEKAMSDAATGSREASDQTSTLTFRTAMARDIYKKCIEQFGSGISRQKYSTAFQHDRMVYEFSTDTFSSSSLPTIMNRSQEDCGPIVPLVSIKLPVETRTKLGETMSILRSGSKHRKSDRYVIPMASPSVALPVQIPPPSQPPPSLDDDFDIFDDVGEYVCQPHATTNVKKERIVFQQDQEEITEPATIDMHQAIVQAKSTAGQVGVFEKKQTSELEGTGAGLSMLDEYDEYTAGMYDDDDDDGGPARPEKANLALSATKISRAKAKEKQKLNTQWQQITTIIDKKKKNRQSSDEAPIAKKTRLG